MLMERGQNEQQHKQRFAFLEEKPCLFYLSQIVSKSYTWFSCIPNWKWITERMYDHISIYTGYIQGGLGAINLDSPLTASTGI